MKDEKEFLEDDDLIIDTGLDFLQKKESKYSTYYFCKLRTKKEIIPHFEMSKDIAGVITKLSTKQPIQSIRGKLMNIEFKEGTFQGQPIKSVVFKIETLNDSGNLVCFRMTTSRNNALQNWINCLLSQNTRVESIELSVWKDKTTGYNKSTCRINGQKPKWQYSIDEMEEKKEKIFDKKGNLIKVKNDDLFDFLEEELKNKLDILLPNRIKEDTIDSVNLSSIISDDEQDGKTDEFIDDMFNELNN